MDSIIIYHSFLKHKCDQCFVCHSFLLILPIHDKLAYKGAAFPSKMVTHKKTCQLCLKSD